MSQTTDVDIQEALERMIRDTIRVRCRKVLLSPKMYHACLDRIAWWDRALDNVPPITGNVFVRGVPAEQCTALGGTDYALVPKSPENTVTVNGIPLEFIPPFNIKETNVGNERPMIALIREFRKWNSEWEKYDKNPRLPKPLGVEEFAEICERKFVVALVPSECSKP